MARHPFDFKCYDCRTKFESCQDVERVKEGYAPPCPACNSRNVKRVWTFGQFTFAGGLPSNAGRDPMKVWR